MDVSHMNIYIYIFFFLVRKTFFFAQAFANLDGKRRQGKFIGRTRIYMLQTGKHDTAKLILYFYFLFFSLIKFL